MYSLTDAAKTAFKKFHKYAEITFYGTDKIERTISSEHIWGLELTRASVSGDTIAIGEFCASTLTLTLNNGDGYFDDFKFSGGYMYVRLKVTDDDGNTYYMPLGYFLVDSAPRKTKKITVDCYDRAVLFDYDADFTGLTFPATLSEIADYCLTRCAGTTGMSLATKISSLPNGTYTVAAAPDSDMTYRQVLMAIAEITGTVAFMNTDGDVEFKFYTQSGEQLTTAERYSHDLYEDDTVITGVEVVDEDGTAYLAGGDTYAFAIEDNALLQSDYKAIAATIYAAVQSASVDSETNFYYRAYEAETVSLPYLEPLDIITYVEPDGTEHPAIITNLTFVMNGKGKLEGRSDSSLEQGLASVGALTAKQKAIIAAVEKAANEAISDLDSTTTARIQAVSQLNETISNALGLYVIAHKNDDGSITYWFSDVDDTNIAKATVIYCFNSGGFSWVQGDDCYKKAVDNQWSTGITKDGNAVLNLLSVYKLSAAQIEAGTITVDNLAAGVLSVENIAYSDDETLADQLKLYVTSSSLTTTLTSYATTSEVENTLKSYVTSSGLETTLSSYITSGDLSTELKSYVTSSSLTTTLTSYATTSAGTSSSFSYSLTSTDFTLKADGNTVFAADKNGITVTGTVNATSGTFTNVTIQSGTIGGLTIAENSISSSNGYFSISSAGVLTATGAKISGEVNATSGTFNTGVEIGDFTITTVYGLSGNVTPLSDEDTGQLTALYTSKYISLTKKALKFYDGSSSYMSYSNLDYQGFGSIWRTSNTDGEREQTGITQFPYVALDCYAQGGLAIYYWASLGNLGNSLQVWLDSGNSFMPTIEADGDLVITADSVNVGANTLPSKTNSYTLGTSNNYWKNVYAYNAVLGYGASAYTTSCVAIGYNATAAYSQDTVIGYGAYSCSSTTSGTPGTNVVIGYSAYISNDNTYGHSVVIGANAKAVGSYSIALGYSASASAYRTIAIGYGVSCTNSYEVKLGRSGDTVYLAGSEYSSSDERDKTDIEDYDDEKALEFITSLRTFSYRSNFREEYEYTDTDEDGNETPTEYHNLYGLGLYDTEAYAQGTKKGVRKRSGVSAQDITEQMKNVFGDSDFVHLVNDSLYNKIAAGETIPDGIESKKTVNYCELIPFLISAIRAQQKQIEALKESK